MHSPRHSQLPDRPTRGAAELVAAVGLILGALLGCSLLLQPSTLRGAELNAAERVHDSEVAPKPSAVARETGSGRRGADARTPRGPTPLGSTPGGPTPGGCSGLPTEPADTHRALAPSTGAVGFPGPAARTPLARAHTSASPAPERTPSERQTAVAFFGSREFLDSATTALRDHL